MHLVTQRFSAAQYTGGATSAQDVLAMVQATAQGSTWTLQSYDSAGVTLHEINETYDYESDCFMRAGWWFVASSVGIIDCLDDDAFQAKWAISGGGA